MSASCRLDGTIPPVAAAGTTPDGENADKVAPGRDIDVINQWGW
jgi:hypothetical protein